MKLKNHIVKNKEILRIWIIYTNYITQKTKKTKKKTRAPKWSNLKTRP